MKEKENVDWFIISSSGEKNVAIIQFEEKS